MEVSEFKERQLSEEELKVVISLNPHLIVPKSKVLGQEVSVSNGRMDLVLSSGDNLIIVEVKSKVDYTGLFQCGYYYTQVLKERKALEEKLNTKIKDVSVILVVPHSEDWLLEMKELFKESYPFKIVSYKAIETAKDNISIQFYELNGSRDSNEKCESIEKVSASTTENETSEDQRDLAKAFITSISEQFGDEVRVDEKDWGYSVKSGRRVVLCNATKKSNRFLQIEGRIMQLSLFY